MSNKTNVEVLSLKNPAFSAYIVCCCILAVKMFALAFLTGHKRMRNKAFLSPEDATFFKAQVIADDDVERVRRAHQNDLENIPVFFTTAFAYLWVKPPACLACGLFFTFTIARIAHTIVYAVFVVRQPARMIVFSIGLLITLYMALHAMVVGFAHI